MNVFRIKPWHMMFLFAVLIFIINIIPAKDLKRQSDMACEIDLSDLDNQSFQDSISSGLAYVLFYHENSDVCSLMNCNLSHLAINNQDIKFYKFNLDQNKFNNYNISGAPYTLIFKDGEPIQEIMGIVPMANLEMINNRVLK